MRALRVRKREDSGIHISVILGATKSDIVVTIRRMIPVTIGAPQIVWIIDPRPATQQTL